MIGGRARESSKQFRRLSVIKWYSPRRDTAYLKLVLTGLSSWAGVEEINGENLVHSIVSIDPVWTSGVTKRC